MQRINRNKNGGGKSILLAVSLSFLLLASMVAAGNTGELNNGVSVILFSDTNEERTALQTLTKLNPGINKVAFFDSFEGKRIVQSYSGSIILIGHGDFMGNIQGRTQSYSVDNLVEVFNGSKAKQVIFIACNSILLAQNLDNLQGFGFEGEIDPILGGLSASHKLALTSGNAKSVEKHEKLMKFRKVELKQLKSYPTLFISISASVQFQEDGSFHSAGKFFLRAKLKTTVSVSALLFDASFGITTPTTTIAIMDQSLLTNYIEQNSAGFIFSPFSTVTNGWALGVINTAFSEAASVLVSGQLYKLHVNPANKRMILLDDGLTSAQWIATEREFPIRKCSPPSQKIAKLYEDII